MDHAGVARSRGVGCSLRVLFENQANVGIADRRQIMRLSPVRILAAAGTLVFFAACSDSSTSPAPSSVASQELTAAFLSTPAGFSSTENTFNANSDEGEAWMPDRSAHEDEGNMMAGGVGPEFFGGAAFGRGFDHGPFGFGFFLFNCTFS